MLSVSGKKVLHMDRWAVITDVDVMLSDFPLKNVHTRYRTIPDTELISLSLNDNIKIIVSHFKMKSMIVSLRNRFKGYHC